LIRWLESGILEDDLFSKRFGGDVNRIFPLILFLVFLPASLPADVITLKNGDRITGKIVKKDGASLTIAGELTGEVTVPWDAVTNVTSDEPLNVVLPGDETVVGRIEGSADRIEVATPAGPRSAGFQEVGAIRNAAQQRASERFLDPGVFDLWAGYFDLGFSLARGNARTNTFTNAFNASRVTPRDKATVYFNQVRSTATIDGISDATAEAIRGGWAYNKNVSPRTFFNMFNDYEYDRFQDLDLRFVLGGGAGFNPIRTERTRLDIPVGFAYNREKFDTPLIRNSGEAYWGDEFTYKVNSTTSLRQAFRMFHNLTDSGIYRINFDLGASMSIRRWIAWQVTASNRMLSNPVAGRKRADVLVTTGFRFSFAR
jgi:putative salt-induced outer membrane protein YdiY